MKYILLLLLTFNAIANDAFIKPAELKELQKDKNLVLLDVSSKSFYNQSHISGAVHVDINMFIKRKYFKRAFNLNKIVQSQMKKLGINENSKVVIYSRNKEKDLLDSSYLAMIFTLYGFEDITILDGGYMAWVFEYSFLVSSKSSSASKDGTYKIKQNKNIIVNTSYLKKKLNDSQIIDSRESSKYYGKIKSNGTKLLGHILNAKNYYYGDSFFDDLTIKNDIEQNFISKLGLQKNQEIIIYGDTIFTSSMNWFILYKEFGFTNAKICPEPFYSLVSKKVPLTLYK
ncbi:MAG: thiosulfate sulfurtransferase [Sulfurimonas sp.]|nr:thiosulfate sulfurtransferase [Sulfurimonas sp.]